MRDSTDAEPTLIEPGTTTLLLVVALILLLVIKLFLASRLDLYSDEIFYWLASTRLAPAYSDLPFMTSLLVWLGSNLSPGSPLAVRSLFILLGSSVPLLVFWLAQPITGRKQALFAALLALCIPLGGFLGLLAVPDVPLLFFGLLAIGFFERALRTDQLRYWIATGLVVGLGLCTHYRFVLYPAAAVLFLLVFEAERRQWRNPRLWMAMSLGAVGLLPIAWFNLTNELASASFYLVERHPWSFQLTGLLHVFKQAGLVTPPLYALLVGTLWHMLQRAGKGCRSAGLLACFALVNLAVYLVLAPWTDASSTSIHWPLSGYFPLLVFAPSVLSRFYQWIAGNWNQALAKRIAVAIPALGFAGTVAALAGIGSQAYQEAMQSIVGTGVLSNKMAGWEEFAAHTSQLLENDLDGDVSVVVTDNYYTAAQVKFAGISDRTYTVDSDKAIRDGRLVQMQLWNMDESALTAESNQPAVFVSEDSTLSLIDKESVMKSICRYVDDLHYMGDLTLFNGDKRFSYYQIDRIVSETSQSAYDRRRCPFPARAWIDQPTAGALLEGVIQIQGWAYNEDIGIATVHLLLDGQPVTQLEYGARRPDVVAAMAVVRDPNAPDLGYSGDFDTRGIGNGNYELTVLVTDNRGTKTSFGHRQVRISN